MGERELAVAETWDMGDAGGVEASERLEERSERRLPKVGKGGMDIGVSWTGVDMV